MKYTSLLPEAFAAAREAAWRVLGMKPYRVQIIGGIVLHQGRIAEMRTGEGKTLRMGECPGNVLSAIFSGKLELERCMKEYIDTCVYSEDQEMMRQACAADSFQESLEAADQGRNKQTKKAMREAIEGASWSVRETGEVTRRDENGVNITEQMTEIIRNSYQMQYLYQSLNSDMNALRTAIGG